MRTNGHKPQAPLANLVIPGAAFTEDAYAGLKLRLDCYDDFILARQFDKGIGGSFYALDPTDVATALAGVKLGTPALPPGCLFWQRADGGERLGIYAGPQIWQVNVSTDKKRELLAVPMPGLVWIGQGTAYSLFAVKDEWPGPQTELFRAPCPNVGTTGICRGDVAFPAADVATIWPALRLFFESDFNNHLSNVKSRRFTQNVLAAWRELDGAGAEEWPEDDLVSAETTLGKVIEK